MFDDIPTIRYLYDNDRIGRVEMEKKLKRKKNVFMWGKLVRDFKIRKPVKDFNELIEYCWKQKNDAVKHYGEYFTNNPLDIRSV
jgi:formate-dependent nitrite reductase cytochrome c552 subunit